MTGSFRARARAALKDEKLQKALANVPGGFIVKRAKARARLPEFDKLRDEASAMKRHVLDNLHIYLSAFIEKAEEAGAKVHLAADSDEANRIITDILKARGARRVTKGKSMISEETELNAALERAGFEVVETDLGEYIIQLRGEKPSHIVAPAIHLSRKEIEPAFRKAHASLPKDRQLVEKTDFVNEARAILREKFCSADAGITGANLLIAETGSTVLVTNEGNGDLTASLPKTHIVISSIDKIVPAREDASLILRLLARSATGQEITSYTSFFTGPARPGDVDGPEEMHIVLLDNNRSRILGGPFSDILKCIRCGACLNHCPVFGAVGGHAYGGVYPGPMGEVLAPALHGIGETSEIVDACTMCGRCAEVCPMRISLPGLIREWRFAAFDAGKGKPVVRAGLRIWGWLARHPRLYALSAAIGVRLLKLLAAGKGAIRALPGLSGWLSVRDLPAPEGRTFTSLWRKVKGRRGS
jgi:L-lactate dehydrogenase complex protein LldF